MATILTTVAQEQSTYIITCAFTDEDGDAVIPDSIVWSLTDTDGTVINSRDQEAVSVPAASVDIVLSGDDLALQSGETATKIQRRLLVEAVADTDAGNDLPLKAEAIFLIENLTKIT